MTYSVKALGRLRMDWSYFVEHLFGVAIFTSKLNFFIAMTSRYKNHVAVAKMARWPTLKTSHWLQFCWEWAMSQRRIRRGANEEQDAAQLKLGEGNMGDNVGILSKFYHWSIAISQNVPADRFLPWSCYNFLITPCHTRSYNWNLVFTEQLGTTLTQSEFQNAHCLFISELRILLEAQRESKDHSGENRPQTK
jgi:hypothetical protein